MVIVKIVIEIVVTSLTIINTYTSLRELDSLFAIIVLVVNEKYFIPFVVIITRERGFVVRIKGNKLLNFVYCLDSLVVFKKDLINDGLIVITINQMDFITIIINEVLIFIIIINQMDFITMVLIVIVIIINKMDFTS